MTMAKKKQLEGYEKGGEFHPIRSSAGYSRKEAGESRKKPAPKAKSNPGRISFKSAGATRKR